MSKEKQIEEMARFMCNCYDEGYCRMDGKLCDLECGSYKESEIFYEAGYRKQSEGEWIEQVKVSKEGKPLLRHYKCNLCGVYLATQANFCPNCGANMKGA